MENEHIHSRTLDLITGLLWGGGGDIQLFHALVQKVAAIASGTNRTVV